MKQTSQNTGNWLQTAQTLTEALPYFQRYDNARIVIKLGGHAMSDDEAMKSFAREIVLMKQTNIHPIIVHGGGPMINAMLEKLEIPSEFVNGKRVTTPEIMRVVEMVLSGQINKQIVQAINHVGGRAVGLSGKDANLVMCEPTDEALGLVGTPSEVNPSILETFVESDFIPVIAPIGAGRNLESYNINGDTMAGAIAGAIKADRLLLLTDVAGVKDRDGDVITQLTPEMVRALIADGSIQGGMIPKVETAIDAVEKGVRAVVILDGRQPHAVMMELFTKAGAGTLIRAELTKNGR